MYQNYHFRYHKIVKAYQHYILVQIQCAVNIFSVCYRDPKGKHRIVTL
jgi:hypothetical protein